MRIAFFALFVSIFFLGITYYFFVEVSPFDEAKIEEIVVANELKPGDEEALFFELDFIIERGLVMEYLSSNAYVGLASLATFFTLIFFALNLIIDKLFFKTLIDPPDYSLALRRSLEFALALGAFLSLKLRGINTEVALLAFVIALGLDVFIESFRKSKQKTLQEAA